MRTRGCCTGLGQDQVGPKSTNSPWYSAWSVDQMASMAARCSRDDVVPAGPVDAVVLGLGPVPAVPDPEGDPAAGEMVERGHLLGQQDRLVLGGEQDAGAESDARGDGGGGGQRDQRVEAALVVVEAHAADERGRRVLLDGEVGVLGQVERVEAELLDRGGEDGRRQVVVGQGGGDAEAHGQDPAAVRSGGELGQGAAPDRAAEQRAERGLLAAVGLDHGVAAGRPARARCWPGWPRGGARRCAPPARPSRRARCPRRTP